jgi:hypothetical protein
MASAIWSGRLRDLTNRKTGDATGRLCRRVFLSNLIIDTQTLASTHPARLYTIRLAPRNTLGENAGSRA